MKLKQVTRLMYATARVKIYDPEELNYGHVYKGEAEYIPNKYKNRKIGIIGSDTTYINIFLEYDE